MFLTQCLDMMGCHFSGKIADSDGSKTICKHLPKVVVIVGFYKNKTMVQGLYLS